MSARVLIIDDELKLTGFLSELVRAEGFVVETASRATEARTKMAAFVPEIVLLDLVLPDAQGTDLLAELRECWPEVAFIIVTGHGSIRSAVAITRLGAIDYLTKPVDPEELLLALRKAVQSQTLREEVSRLRSKTVGAIDPSDTSLVRSAAMRRTLLLARRAASQDGIVLLLGESGTGKDHLARFIHRVSRRAKGPFFSINCAALSRELAESELFGHEPGAFTGTRGRKRGLLELAERGTLLLNEIGELDAALQSKLLTFLDTKSFMRVGGESHIMVDARIMAATNRDLELEVERGAFRKDLFYRLNVFPLPLPPLRDRKEDIPPLAEALVGALSLELGLPKRATIDPSALAVLAAGNWPGNIRELRNVLERALIVSGRTELDAAALNLPGMASDWTINVSFPAGHSIDFHNSLQTVARQLVLEALRRSSTRQEAAKLLGLSRHALAYQLKVLGIDA